MFCGNCGNKLADGSLVCDKCGFKLVEDEVENVEKAAEQVVEEVKEVTVDVQSQVAEVPQQVVETLTQAVENIPQVVESVPQIVEPVAQVVESVPKVVEPVAQVVESVPQVVEPVAQVVENVPQVPGVNNEVQAEQNVPAQNSEQAVAEKKGEKKRSKAPLIIVASIAAILIIVGALFLFSASLRNSVKKAFMSDESYYRSVQKDALMKIADTVLDQYDEVLIDTDMKSKEVKFDTELIFEKEAEEFLDKLDDSKNLDLTWLNKATAKFVVGTKDSNAYATADVDVNKKDIFDFDARLDMGTKAAYIGLPVLSDVFAQINLPEEMFEDEEDEAANVDKINDVIKALPTKKELRSITEKYLDIILNRITKVKMTEDKVVKVSGISVDCTKAVVNFDADDLNEIELDLLKALSDDNEVASIINRLNATDMIKLDYGQFLDGIEKEIDNVKDRDGGNTEARIEAYIDSTGEIVSFDITLSNNGGSSKGGDDESIGYKLVENSDNYGFEAYSTRTTSRRTYTLFAMKAVGTRSGSKITGNVDFIVDDRNVQHLDYNELNINALLDGELDGQFLFNIYEKTNDKTFKNVMLKVEADGVKSKSGEVTATAYYNKVAIAKLVVGYKTGSGSSVKAPSKTEEVKNINDFTDWMDSFKWDKMLDNMETADFPRKMVRTIESLAKGDFSSMFGGMSKVPVIDD